MYLLAGVSGEFVILDRGFAGGPEVAELAVVGLLAEVIQLVNLQGLRSQSDAAILALRLKWRRKAVVT